MKTLLLRFVSTSLFSLLFGSLIFAQTDTVMVPYEIDGDYYGAMNKYIAANPGHGYYKLEGGQYYMLSGAIEVDFPLRLIADKPDDLHPPPVVVMADLVDGDRLLRYFILYEDAQFTNIYFLGAHPNGQLDVNVHIEILKNDGQYLFDGCYFEWSEWVGVMVMSDNVSVTVKNCIIKNFSNPVSKWNSRFLSFRDNPVDTVIMTNNTWYNSHCFFLDGRKNIFNYVQFEHNTLVNNLKWPIQWQWATDAKISNNIFYNSHCFGEAPVDLPGQDFDGLLFGIVNTDTLLAEHDFPEADRKVDVHNNCWFYTQEITDYWDSYSADKVSADNVISYEPFMNSRTQAMFDNDVDWPGLNEFNTRNMDPGFLNVEGTADLVAWMNKERNYESRTYWGPDPDGNRFSVTWPIDEDFSYTNATLLTGAECGFPVGDLNWFSGGELEDWETNGCDSNTGIIGPGALAKEFELGQNYPNPFTSTTTISYNLNKAGRVKLTIYNMLGQQIEMLVNETLQPGFYEVLWNRTEQTGLELPGGIYFYQLEMDHVKETRKMFLLR
ncbi:MAG: T9SS type A sorting domain-containing protein [Bacteroidota bacterium]